jgi:imidazolonepropionase-like amidohydrolase
MTKLVSIFLLLLAGPAAAQTPVTVFFDVDVVPGDRAEVLKGQTVVVQGGRITLMGAGLMAKLPAGATRIDGKGKYLMPGLTEMHGHLPTPYVTEDFVEKAMVLFLANGVTTVRGVQGAPNQLGLRDRIARGELLGPRLFCYGPAMGKDLTTPEAAEAKVKEYRTAGYDGLKIHEGLTVPVYQAIVRGAKQSNLPFGGHVPNEVALLQALALGQKSIEHLDGYVEALAGDYQEPGKKGDDIFRGVSAAVLERVDQKKLPALVEATRKAGAVATPTMMVWRILFRDVGVETLRKLPELKYWPAAEVEEWITQQGQAEKSARPAAELSKLMGLRRRVLKALADAHLVVMASDTPFGFSVPGFSLRNETREMVAAGLTPAQVIEAGTIAPARYFGLEREAGTVAVGKRADLILVEGNPLQDVANIFRSAGVMVNGRWLPRAELDARLAEIERAMRWLPPKDLAVPPAEAAALSGTYTLPAGAGGKTIVSVEKGALVMTDREGKSHRLLSQGGRAFVVADVKATVNFSPAQGPAATVVFTHGQFQIRGTRAAR